MYQLGYLNAMIVGVGDDDVVLSTNSDARRLRELALHDAEFAELAVVDHFLAFDLRARWIQLHLHLQLILQLARHTGHAAVDQLESSRVHEFEARRPFFVLIEGLR